MKRMCRGLRETLAVLDVGHGSSAVLFSGDDVAVFDAGPGPGLLEFLEEQNVNHIGPAAVTVTVPKTSRSPARIVVSNLSTYLAARGPGSTDRSGRRITSNSISAVIRLTVGADPIALLTGDLDVVGFDDLLSVGSAMDAPVLVFPHHGGGVGGSNVAGFVTNLVKYVRPRVVLFSIGRRRKGTPDPQVVHYLRQEAPAARIVCTQLSQHCASARPTFTSTHLSTAFARGRSDHACCGGTILISLRNPSQITPASAGHLAFIRRAAQSPLCV